jgi:hypothetical protein
MAENVAELEMRPADLKRSERVDPAKNGLVHCSTVHFVEMRPPFS